MDQDTIKNLAVGASSISGIELMHQVPAEEPIKLGMQILLAFVNLIWIMKQNRQGKKLIRRKRKQKQDGTEQ